jgi:hypothetical protein
MFENRVLGRIFVPKGEEMVGGYRRLHNEELHNLYSRVIKSRMRWATHVARMEEMRNTIFWLLNLMEETTQQS